jgi:2'-5' RNA ligase
MKRLFAAVKIHPDEPFIRVYNHLKKTLSNEKIKWVDLENVHITLKFFGETQEDLIPGIITALDDATIQTEPIDITLKGTGIFGSNYAPRVIWFGLEDQGRILHLSKSIEENLHGIGFISDRQNFVPHLTIGRIKEIHNKNLFQNTIKACKDEFFGIENINHFHLFESHLLQDGPKYSILHTFDLQL